MKILIVGKVPPPKGGVGVHVERLIYNLKLQDKSVVFFDMRKENLFSLPTFIWKSDIVHLHTSSSYFRILTIFICKILFKKVIFTFHGNLYRYNVVRNFIDTISIKLADRSIIINKKSIKIAQRISSKARYVSAFIAPTKIEALPVSVNNKLENFLRKDYKMFFCANANSLVYTKEGNEIYGFFLLLDVFSNMTNLGLIFSDASSAYTSYLRENNISVPENILILNEVHDFQNIILKTSVFIRPTFTDGDSLSVREGLFYKKIVLCSDCVDRPNGVQLFKTGEVDSLSQMINEISMMNTENIVSKNNTTCATHDLISIYEDTLGHRINN